jgi:poly(A) polymerase
MKITGNWINQPATQAVCHMLESAGYQALFVGGCVRNALLDVPVNDIDIATDALPDQVMRLADAADFKVIPTGLDHGTVTVISDSTPHEITTFREDVQTHGRHATVAFSEDIAQDARRRDFTMNALYAKADGTVLDPLEGLADLRARRVRFIEDAEQRICEDYLRILRFFRFHAWYGDASGGLDAEGLAAVAAHVEGLEGLSRERVGAEMLKLLAAADPAPAVAAMRSTGVLTAILKGADDRALGPLVHLEAQENVAARPLRRLAALGGMDVAKNLRLSKRQAKQLDLLTSEIGQTTGAAELGYRHGADTGMDIMLLRAAMLEMPLAENLSAELSKGADAIFPIAALDLMPELEGPALGARLKELETRWIASGFTLSKPDLL